MKAVLQDIPVIEIPEWTRCSIPPYSLDAADRDLIESLNDHGAGRLQITELRKGIQIETRSWVGVIRFSSFALNVLPKLAGTNLDLARMIDYSLGLSALRRLGGIANLKIEGNDLFDLVVLLFTECCEWLLRRGLLSSYVQVEDDLPVVRGRFLADKQILKRFGLIDRLECRYDERLADIPENQVLLMALSLSIPHVSSLDVLQRVHRLRAVFGSVCSRAEEDWATLRGTIRYNRLNDHYRDPHTLAWLIFDSLAFSDIYQAGKIQSFAFLLDMNALFERFIHRWLSQLLAREPLVLRSWRKDYSILWDADQDRPYAGVIPDFLIRRRGMASPSLPLDAKYKLYDEKALVAGDIYQTFLYATAYGETSLGGTPAAVIVYPASSPSSTSQRLLIRNEKRETASELVVCGIHIPSALAEAESGGYGVFGQRILDWVRRYLPSGDTEAS